MIMDEIFDRVDENDRIIGQARRRDCHGNPDYIHRAVHVLVFNRRGQLLLQKRSVQKDIQPGKWDTSVGGHLDQGEDYRAAAVREMAEELQITGQPLTELYPSKIRNRVESENILTYLCIYEGKLRYAPAEIDEVRYWSADEIHNSLGRGCFTPNFEEEWQRFNLWLRRYLPADRQQAFCAGDSFPELFKRILDDEA